jgi:hypothetical protein
MTTGMFAFLLGVLMSFVSATASLSLQSNDSQSLDSCQSVPNNTMDCDDVACEKSEWDMLSVALAMYKLYWVELRQKEADDSPTKRCRFEVMPPLRRENTIAQISSTLGCLGSAIWDFLTLIITLLPKLGDRAANILAMVVMVFIALYLFISRGFGDYLVRATQMAVIGFIFPNSSALVKEF